MNQPLQKGTDEPPKKGNDLVQKEKAAKNSRGTGGYDGQYAAGYASSAIAPQIRDTAINRGEKLQQAAQEAGLAERQTEGYFAFGAGKVIETGRFSLIVPTSFVYQEHVYNQELVSFSSDQTLLTREESPLEIWVEHLPLQNKMMICTFFQLQLEGAHMTGRTYRELVVSGKPAVLTMEKSNAFPAVARVAVLLNNGLEMYRLKIIFHSNVENIDSLVHRIYAGMRIKE